MASFELSLSLSLVLMTESSRFWGGRDEGKNALVSTINVAPTETHLFLR